MKTKKQNLLALLLMLVLLTAGFLSSCKKEENKSPIITTQPVTVNTTQKYLFVSGTGQSMSSVVDTISLYTTDNAVKLTIPLEYNSKYDTIQLDSIELMNGYIKRRFNHLVKYNTAYTLDGYVIFGVTNGYINSPNSILLQFDQRIATGQSIAFYDLSYTKI